MKYLPLLLLTSCVGMPDRYNAGVSRGNGTLDGKHDYDTEDTRLELGVSGPLWSPPPRRMPPPLPEPCPPLAPPTAPPVESEGLPWEELLLILLGAGCSEGSRYGVKKYKSRKQG